MTTHSAAAEQPVLPAENEQPRGKSIVDDFAGYRALRRRVEDMHSAGLENPFIQPRDEDSHNDNHQHNKNQNSNTDKNKQRLNGHPAVTAAAKNAIDKYGTSA